MKKVLIIFLLLITLISCGNGREKESGAVRPEKDRIEVIYFFGQQRCLTCRAIEKHALDAVNDLFPEEIKNGKVVFKTVDISSPDGESIADNYEVAGSSLFINKWENGEETRKDMTEFAFMNARRNPETFKKGVTDIIKGFLK